MIYMDGSSKRITKTAKERVGGFGVFATIMDRKSGSQGMFQPSTYAQTYKGAELWEELEALHYFWVPKLAILTDSQHSQQGASGKAHNWKSRGWTTA